LFISDFLGNHKHLLKKVQEYEASVLFVQKTLCQLFDIEQVECWVYFLVNGAGFHCQTTQNKKGLAA
jgi:hypothetical protein